MMLVIEVEFLHGTFRGSSEDLALTGLESAGEWPPSPARLLAAFVAADGTRDRSRITDGRELMFLERQPPPVIVADPRSDVAFSSMVERFVVVNERAEGTAQEYPGRSNSIARPGKRMAPFHPKVAYVWESSTPDDSVVAGLRRRAARIGYLGTSDSPVRVSVSTGAPASSEDLRRWVPDPDGDVALPVPFEGQVGVLDTIYDRFRNKPKGVTGVWGPRRSAFRTERSMYRSPDAGEAPYRVPAQVLWLRFDRPVPGRRVVVVTDTLRRAVMDIYQRRVIGVGEELPPVLTGHGFEGGGYEHASWLALPDVGGSRNRGRLFGAAIMLPAGTPADVVEGVRSAVAHLHRLIEPGVFAVEVRPYDGESRPWASNPARWTRPSVRFSSAFPVVHERFVRPHPTLDDVAAWCRHAGLPDPVAMAVHRRPTLPGAVSLHPAEVRRREGDRRPYSHMDLLFDRPVVGPVVIGAGRHFGLGLFAPVADEKSEDRRG